MMSDDTLRAFTWQLTCSILGCTEFLQFRVTIPPCVGLASGSEEALETVWNVGGITSKEPE